MGRFLLVLVVAAAALASPAVRARIQPYVQPALDPVYEWSARSKLKEVARMIGTERASGRGVPAPREFTRFMERRYRGADGTLDPWGSPYYLEAGRGGTVIGSPGRDRTRGTADDIVEPI